ncbi:MAG TPA: cyclic nucleotide-binding domain-containing protein [Longilinea sp.]|nr:cyclic nucleotide-binding domain-containing protein [Longilinea sp.]
MGKYINFLRETSLFYNLTNAQLEMVDAMCEEMVFQKDQVIYEEGSRQNDFYLVFSGTIELTVTPQGSSKPVLVDRVEKGSLFGETALVEELPRATSARSIKDTHVLRIARNKFMLLCNTYADLGYRVMFNLAVCLAEKMKNPEFGKP